MPVPQDKEVLSTVVSKELKELIRRKASEDRRSISVFVELLLIDWAKK